MQTQILGLVTPLMVLFFAATFVVLWRVGRMKRHVLGYGIAFALSAVAAGRYFLPLPYDTVVLHSGHDCDASIGLRACRTAASSRKHGRRLPHQRIVANSGCKLF